jgi:membrane protein involved in colicin uptake
MTAAKKPTAAEVAAAKAAEEKAAKEKAEADKKAAEDKAAQTYSGTLTYPARVGNKTLPKGKVDDLSEAEYKELIALKCLKPAEEEGE